jgi:hypothetical protein
MSSERELVELGLLGLEPGRRYQDPRGSFYCVGWEEYAPGHSHVVVYDHKPGRRYCRHCWPPRRRGKGEAETSPRRIQAKLRAAKALEMSIGANSRVWRDGLTWDHIAERCGYNSRTAAWLAVDRLKRQLAAEKKAALYDLQEHEAEMRRRADLRRHLRAAADE